MDLTLKNRIRDPVQLQLAADLCIKSKQLYNFTNYIIRDHFFATGQVLSYVDVYHIVKVKQDSNGDVPYKRLPSAVAQQVLKQLSTNWKSFLRATKEHRLYPSKFKGKPKPPGYLKRFNVVSFDRSRCLHTHDGMIHFAKHVLKPVSDLSNQKVKLIRLVPHHDACDIEYVYETIIKPHVPGNVLAIDPGLNNFITTVDDAGNNPFIINGGIIKSVNQQYNKQKSDLQSKLPNNTHTSHLITKISRNRENRLNDQLHKISRTVVNYCISQNITTVVIGHNKNQKQKINLGTKTNQNFTTIPHYRFNQKLKYKCELEGIKFVTVNEAYTSKCSYLDNEPVAKQQTYLGKRITRGVFSTANGTLINADVNAAYNILKLYTNKTIINPVIFPFKITVK